jgi:hypothetical protein
VNRARRDLSGGRRVTGVPTAIRDGHGDVAHDKASRYQQLLSYPQQYLRAVQLVAVRIDWQLPPRSTDANGY